MDGMFADFPLPFEYKSTFFSFIFFHPSHPSEISIGKNENEISAIVISLMSLIPYKVCAALSFTPEGR